ncbi:MAG: ABC transporter ATP-binding protein [Tepidimonas taiwanensis]|nr:ABC transporter ATP-binding protein [Tepidimonas taiwanensis]
MSGIALRGLTRRFGGLAAVDGIDLDAAAGEFVVLLGPSGCGKSTTLRLIAGLEPADAGRIAIDGRDVTTTPAAERGIAMVFQSYALFPHLSVAENIVFGLRVRRLPRAERERRLTRAAELLGLHAVLQRKPAELSGGQRQRVALGRAIVAEAPVCLMDEPLSNLDAQLRQHMRSEIRELQQRLGMTMVYVTHDQTEAMTMADRVVLMRAGRIEQQGSPRDLYERPASTFVAGFIGAPAMNLMTRAGEPTLGVRPEHIQVCAPEDGWPARVVSHEYLGAETLLVCETTHHGDSAQLVVRTALERTPARGENVGLRWSPAAEHRFDSASGQRLSDFPQPPEMSP